MPNPKTIVLAVIACLSLVSAACPSYSYHDFTWASSYTPPARPPDTLLDNCRALNLSNPALCDVIQNGSLSIEQRKQLILDDFVKNNGFPPYSEAQTWNSGLNYTKYPPDNTTTQSGPYLRDAWVKITSLNPAVIDSATNKTLVNDTGKLGIAKGFTFVVPQQSFPADCRTEYEVCGYNYALQAYDNGQPLAMNGSTANFEVPDKYPDAQNDFSAVMTANSEYFIHHYRRFWRCCWHWSCEYVNSEDRRDSIQVTDSKTAYYYAYLAFTNAFVDSFNGRIADGWLFVVSNEDFNNILFKVGNSTLKLQRRQYQLRPFLPPYNALTPIFTGVPGQVQSYGLSVMDRQAKVLSGQEFDDFLRVTEPALYYWLTQVLGINLTEIPITFYGDKTHYLASSDSLNCSVEINSHFEKLVLQNACRFDASQQPIMNLTISNLTNTSLTASVTFYENSTGQLLVGKKIVFSYGSQNQTVETDANGQATAVFNRTPGVNVVSAKFWTDFETKSARAYEILPFTVPGFLADLWYWLALAIAVWLLYQFLKRSFK